MDCASNIWSTAQSSIRGIGLSISIEFDFLFRTLLFLFFSVPFPESKPIQFFQHGAAVVQDKMYIYGGNHNGRYLSDMHVSNYLQTIVKYSLNCSLCICIVDRITTCSGFVVFSF